MADGKAYGVFDCRAPEGELKAVLPNLKGTGVPSELELTLTGIDTGIENRSWKKELRELMQEAKRNGCRYAIEATLPSATNAETAYELDTVLQRLYQTHLYEEGEPFRGDVTYDRN